jgi:hypothetical protein
MTRWWDVVRMDVTGMNLLVAGDPGVYPGLTGSPLVLIDSILRNSLFRRRRLSHPILAYKNL